MGLPSALQLPGNVITWVAPPLLIHRATTGMRHLNGHCGWLCAFVRRPLAQRIVRWLAGTGARDTTLAMPASASPTEVLLGEAANAIFERLPRDVRLPLAALPDATAALAREAMALRARAEALSAEHRRLRNAPHDAAMLADVEQQRATVRARLGTAIAGLKNIRLDLLRLQADRTLPGSLTEQLDAVRELQRQVDAAAEIQRVLRAPAAERTPVQSLSARGVR